MCFGQIYQIVYNNLTILTIDYMDKKRQNLCITKHNQSKNIYLHNLWQTDIFCSGFL